MDVCYNLNLKFKVVFQVKNSDADHFGVFFFFLISNIKILLKKHSTVHRKCTEGAKTSRNQITMIKQNRKGKTRKRW